MISLPSGEIKYMQLGRFQIINLHLAFLSLKNIVLKLIENIRRGQAAKKIKALCFNNKKADLVRNKSRICVVLTIDLRLDMKAKV